MKAQRRVRVLVELASLAARVVGVEHEAAVVDAAEQHHANRRPAAVVGGRQRDRRRIDVVALRAFDSLEELDDWIRMRHVARL